MLEPHGVGLVPPHTVGNTPVGLVVGELLVVLSAQVVEVFDDDLPESAFLFAGTIDDVFETAQK